MGQVSAHTQIEPQYFVARLQHSQANGRIGLCTTMRLDVGVFAVKYFFQPVDSQLFGLIYDFTTTVIPAAGITFSIFIGHHIAHGLHHLEGGEIFRSYQFNAMSLAFKFFLDEVENELVSLHGAKLGHLGIKDSSGPDLIKELSAIASILLMRATNSSRSIPERFEKMLMQ